MKKLNQSGALDALLVITLIAVVAVGGFVMWRIGSVDDSSATTANTPTATSSNESETEESVNEVTDQPSFVSKYDTSDWDVLISGEGTFSMKIPDGWEVTSAADKDQIRFLSTLYTPEKDVTYYDNLFGSDGFETFTFTKYTSEQYQDILERRSQNDSAEESGTRADDLVEIPFTNGTAVKNEYETRVEATDDFVEQRWITVSYEIVLEDGSLLDFSYNRSPADSDTYPFLSKDVRTDLFDSVISTIEIL